MRVNQRNDTPRPAVLHRSNALFSLIQKDHPKVVLRTPNDALDRAVSEDCQVSLRDAKPFRNAYSAAWVRLARWSLLRMLLT